MSETWEEIKNIFSETFEKIKANIESINTFSWQSLVVGAVCLLIIIFYPKIEKRLPAFLVAVVVGALMVKFIPGLDNGVFTIGELYTIPSGFPEFALSGMEFSLAKVSAVLPDAFTIAILAAIESLLSCVVADGMIVHFNQPQDIQWIYNLCAIVCIIPFSLYYLLGMDEEKAES